MNSIIPIVDLFAGPGGLGEGFHSSHSGKRFRITCSVEMEPSAHRTLTLRAFARQFIKPPPEYYSYISGAIELEELKRRFPEKWKSAEADTMGGPTELGTSDDTELHARIEKEQANWDRWILIGGPPCQAYSVIGRARMLSVRGEKERMRSIRGEKEFDKDPRHLLYRHYLRIIGRFGPDLFVLENVVGLLSSKQNGQRIFEMIRSDLQSPAVALKRSDRHNFAEHHGADPQYRLYALTPRDPERVKQELHSRPELKATDFVVEAEKHGVPQRRHRVIIIGIRTDVAEKADVDNMPTPWLETKPAPSVATVIGGLPPFKGEQSNRKADRGWNFPDSLEEIRMPAEIRSKIKAALMIKGPAASGATTARTVKRRQLPKHLRKWLKNNAPKEPVNHAPRRHMASDLCRYLYYAVAAQTGKSPRLSEIPDDLKPRHKNADSGKFDDRFRVQVAGSPATTITSHIAKDGHYYIHYDPVQHRSLTVREAARLQTFPDNYYFEGSVTDQYRQVGNAVPPFLAHQIAEAVWKILQRAGSSKVRKVQRGA